MQAKKSNIPDKVEAEMLSRMARSTLDYAFLGSINGSDIYQVTEGWQRDVLMKESGMAVVRSLKELKAAMQAPGKEIASVFVVRDAGITQETAIRVIVSNPLVKNIYWEAYHPPSL